VLIQEYTKDLLPEYFRFVQGVVDSEDLPLNVSRETVQSNQIIARVKKILTSEVIKSLKDLSQKEPEEYHKFWEAHGKYIKEGIAIDHAGREELYSLLRFRTDRAPEAWTALKDYVERMPEAQKSIYFLLGDDERSILRSPHLDYFRKTGFEVLLLTDPIDSFMILGLLEFDGHPVQNIASPDLDLPQPAEETTGEENAAVPDDRLSRLVDRFKAQLGDRVTDVRLSTRLSDSVARLVDPEGSLNPEMQRVYRLLQKEFEAPKKVLELNPRHPLLVRLGALADQDTLAPLIVEQIYENALLIEGLHPDPAGMIERIQKIMEAALV
jgi:molecular chaperone HtpG